MDREINVEYIRADNTVAAGVAKQIRATAWNLRKRHALRRDFRSRHGHRVATGVDVTQEHTARIALVIMVDRIEPRNFIWNAECVGTGILHAHGVPRDKGSRRNPTIRLENASQFPSTQHRRRGPAQRGRHWKLPECVDDRGMSEVEVRRRPAYGWGEPEPGGDGIRESIACDGRGVVVHRLAVCVITSELQAVAEPLLDIKLKSVVSGARVPHHPPDDPEIPVDP